MPSRGGGEPHQVLLTSLMKMGNNLAAAAVVHCIRSFPSIEYILMVGIAGGIPNPLHPEDHVRLGDVVVSNEKGILQYDNIKVTPSNTEIRDTSSKPGAALIAAAKSLEAEHQLSQYPWDVHLVLGQRLAGSERPPASTDILFDSHDQSKLIAHPINPQLNRHPNSAIVHLGLIGSANILLKNALHRDDLRDKYGVKAIEMEGSGVADASWSAGKEYIVIRGICDYCDTHKSDAWQAYAALVAAAYARALIEKLPHHPPNRRTGTNQLINQDLTSAINPSYSVPTVSLAEFEKLRFSLGDAHAAKLESIRNMRGQGKIEAAWDALSTELATLVGSQIPEDIQARYFYHAARWAQEDGRTTANAHSYYQAALRLDQKLDDRTYHAFQAVSEKRIDDAIGILLPLNTEAVVINLLKCLLDSDRSSEADGFIEQIETPITHEIRRIHSLCRLATGNSNGAWQVLDELSLSERQDNVLYFLTAGYIAYWQAMPTSFHPPGALSPQFFQPGLISFNEEQVVKMREAMNYLKIAISLVNSVSDQEVRQTVTDAYLAVCINLPERHADVINKAKLALIEAPTAPVPTLCLMRLAADYDWTHTIEILSTTCCQAQPTISEIDLLTNLLVHTSKAEAAWQNLLRFEHRYLASDDQVRWLDRAIRSLDSLGRLPELEARVIGLGNAAEQRRLKASYWIRRGDADKALVLAEDLVCDPGHRLDLINLVHLHRLERMWIELIISADCCLRRFNDAPADVADALAQAWMELKEPDTALAVLQQYRSTFERDTMLDDYFSGCMTVYAAMGQYSQAWDASEPLWARHPNEQLLVHRAQLQILMGEIPRALEILKQGVEQGFKTPRILVTIAHHSLTYDRETAFLWAKRSVECFPNDPRLRASAMQIGFNAGHGDWASMQMAILRRDFSDSGLFQEVSPPNILELLKEQQAHSTENWRQFLDNKLPIHLWIDTTGDGLLGVDFYWRWHFNHGHPLCEHVPFPITFGGLPTETRLRNWEGRILSMDYTACLMAHSLKLFPGLDAAFDEIYVPPCLIGLVQHEIQQLAQAQTDRIMQAERLLNHIVEPKFTLLSEPDLEAGYFDGLQFIDRIKWRLAEQHDLLIVEDCFATEIFELGVIPEVLKSLRISQDEVLTALQGMGELTLEEDHLRRLTDHTPVPEQVNRLTEGMGLLVDQAFLELLLELDGLDAAARIFRLYCVPGICEQLQTEIDRHRDRQKIKDWLTKLLTELNHWRAKGKLKMLPLRPMINERNVDRPLTHELGELLIGVENTNHPVWIDDRLLSSFQNIASSAPIVGVHDILAALLSRKAITDGKFIECFRLLLRADVGCRLPLATYVVKELKQANIDQDTGKLSENSHLIRLRMTVASVLGVNSILGKVALRPELQPEGTHLRLELHRLIGRVMEDIWTTGYLAPLHCAAMSDWIYEKFLPQKGRPVAWESIKADVVQGLALEQSFKMSLPWFFLGHPEATQAYYKWLFPHLEPAWRYNPSLRDAALSRFAELIISHMKGLSLREGDDMIDLFAEPLRFLPKEILSQLLANQALEPKLKGYFTSGTQIDALDLFVPQEDWRKLTDACISQTTVKPLITTLQGRKVTLEFVPENVLSDSIIWSGQAANGKTLKVRLLDPYYRLEHFDSARRVEWLDEVNRAHLLDKDDISNWREGLVREDFKATAQEIRHSCEHSGNFFFAYAGLILGIHSLLTDNWNTILPLHIDIFESVNLTIDLSAAETDRLFANIREPNDTKKCLINLAALPYGPPWDLATAVGRVLSTGLMSEERIMETIGDLAESSFNPVVLQNLLSVSLQLPRKDAHALAETLLQTLLSLDDQPPCVEVDLYIELLHLIWNHFQLNSEFRGATYDQRSTWAYVYANRMLESLLLCRQSQESNHLVVALHNIKEISGALRKRLNPFEEASDDSKDVTLPSAASRWRTVIGGTLGVLKRNADTLQRFPQTVTEMLKPVLDSCNMFDSSKLRGFEFLELTDYPNNHKNSSINNQGWSIATELYAQVSSEQPPQEVQPIHFWFSAVKKGDLDFCTNYFFILARYPVPPEFTESLTGLIEKVIGEKSFSKETKALFEGGTAVLGRLAGEQSTNLHNSLISRAIKSLNIDPTLWIDVCELAFHHEGFNNPIQRSNAFVEVLEKIAGTLSADTREFGEFAAFIRRIEVSISPDIWPRLWSVLGKRQLNTTHDMPQS